MKWNFNSLFFRLTCQVVGSPKPNLTWYFNGQIINPSEKYAIEETADAETTLTINNINPFDNGDYILRAENDIGVAMSKSVLKYDQPMILAFKNPLPEKLDVKLKDSLKIICEIEPVNEPVSFTWHLNGIRLEPSEKTYQLTTGQFHSHLFIKEVNESHFGEISVEVDSKFGKLVSTCILEMIPFEVTESIHVNNITIPIFTKPLKPQEVYRPTEQAILNVEIECKEPTTFNWYSNGIKLEPSKKFEIRVAPDNHQSELIINQLDQNDIANYTCEVVTETGKKIASTCHVDLEIQPIHEEKIVELVQEKPQESAPTKQIKPTIVSHIADLDVFDGQSAEFTCEVDGEMPLTITWYHDEEDVTHVDDFKIDFDSQKKTASLVIKEIFPDDDGLYRCVVTNAHGKVQSVACLRVRENTDLEKQSDDSMKTSVEMVEMPVDKPMETEIIENVEVAETMNLVKSEIKESSNENFEIIPEDTDQTDGSEILTNMIESETLDSEMVFVENADLNEEFTIILDEDDEEANETATVTVEEENKLTASVEVQKIKFKSELEPEIAKLVGETLR